MRIIITIQHAGHVHFFKHAIDELQADGHEVHVFARDNEMSVELLERCGIEYELLAGDSKSLLSLATNQCLYEGRLLQRARQIDPHVMTAVGGVAISHVASVVDARSVVFYDTEHATIICRLAYPFADVVCTPECYSWDVGDKQVRYPGYHELASLHPDRFTPDEEVLRELDLAPDDPLVVVRFGDWGSSHDVGESGFADSREVVDRIDETGAEVVVTAEGDVDADLDPYLASIDPEQLHDLLWFADLYVGEGATTAAECAMLGTPAIYVNSLSLGYLSELESEYGLVFNYTGEQRHTRALERGMSILENDDVDWQRRRESMLEEKRDTTDFILEQLRTNAPSLVKV